jgi:hypothetical protein
MVTPGTLEAALDFYDDLPENPNVRRRDVDPLARRLDDPTTRRM